ncbi:Uncharacterised protein [Serratia plymuthica]|nr:Uncharacterised protein [Serratia plymuthica]
MRFARFVLFKAIAGATRIYFKESSNDKTHLVRIDPS